MAFSSMDAGVKIEVYMPRSHTPREGMQKRNEARIRKMIRVHLGHEIDSVTSELLCYRRAAGGMKGTSIDGEIKYLEDMQRALRRVQNRFKPNISRHVPQEDRETDALPD